MKLDRAFEILLGQPYGPGTYELWFQVASEMFPKPLPSLSELKTPLGDAPSATFDEGDHWWERYRIDPSRSLYVFIEDGVEYDYPEALPAMHRRGWVFDGPQLAALANDEHLDLERLLATTWYVAMRAVTDGSLFDAMAAATCSMSAPRHLLSRADAPPSMQSAIVIEPKWEAALSALGDARFEEHFGMSCVDAETGRWFGSYYAQRDHVPMWLEPVQKRGRELVASWLVGEGQACRAVFKA